MKPQFHSIFQLGAPVPQIMRKTLADNAPWTDECVPWPGAKASNGYGLVNYIGLDGKRHGTQAHRMAYAICVDDIPEGRTLAHVAERGCTDRACINPKHLEPVSHKVTILRSETTVAGANSRKEHCVNGHPFTLENTYFMPNGGRQCRTCKRENQRRYRAEKRANEEGTN